MTRNFKPIVFTWLLVDRTHEHVRLLAKVLEIIALNRIPEAEMSVRTNRARTRSLVKVPATKAELKAVVPINAQGAVLRAFNFAELLELIALVEGRQEWENGS